MSKSNPNVHSKITLLEPASKIKKSIMKSTTDSDMEVRFDEVNKAGVSNLLAIYSQLGNISIEDLESKYKGVGYGSFKKDLVEVVNDALAPIQQRHQEILASGEVEDVLKKGAARANEISQEVLTRVKEKMGFVIF